jgi:chromosome segregation ATPase
VVIDTDVDYAKAADFINDVKAMERRLDEDRVRLKAPFLAGTRQIDEYFRRPLQACTEAVKAVKSVMVAYDQKKARERAEEERRQAEERRRLEAEARERARAEQEAREAAERARLDAERQKREAAEAEARRAKEAQEAAEAKARGDQEAAQAAERRAKQAEDDARRAKEQAAQEREKAIEARRLQLRAEAAAQEAQAEAAKPAPAAVEPIKVAGVARKTAWKFRIKSRTNVPDAYLCPDEAKIQAVVDRLKEMAQESLGDWIEIYPEESLAIGRGRK